jgi:hypothetical protein
MVRPPNRPIAFRLAHELEGLLSGIRADGTIEPDEVVRLRGWLEANESYSRVHPFSELAERVTRALDDGALTLDECDDLLFVVSKLTTVNPHFDQLRGGTQVLMGTLAGICADHVLNDAEIRAFSEWIAAWSHLKSLWPYDEFEAIATAALADGRVDPEEVAYLFALAAQFPVAGGTTLAPTIEFADRDFVFTGESERGTRDVLEQLVATLDGRSARTVTKSTDFLIVCDGGCPHWAFSCYGRKVERAYNLRREGHPIIIVHESDFWGAVTDQSPNS